MSLDFIIRLIGMVIFAILGVYGGIQLGHLNNSGASVNRFTVDKYAFIIGVIGAIAGYFITPYITVRPIRSFRNLLKHLSAQSLFAALAGLIVGLLTAALLAFPLSLLPSPFGQILPFVGVLLFSYLGITVFVMHQTDLFAVISHLTGHGDGKIMASGGEADSNLIEGRPILLDTSVIIDGRIADIARTGFLPGFLLIPRFVLQELQFIADSSDSLRRQRGRRGLEVIANLQKQTAVPVRISDIDVEGVREVDDKLIVLARQLRCPILTNDYNLNRVAELQGVTVLNVNELANAVKSLLLPGEVINIRVIQEGKEANQGVGYIEDGTMVVIENGREYLDREINVVVTKVLQTAAGRMIFARPEQT